MEIAASTSVPPCVPGRVRGHLYVRISSLRWECSTPPPASKLSVRWRWWGEKSEGNVYRVPVRRKSRDAALPCTSGSTVSYPVRCEIKELQKYLREMGPLHLSVGLGQMKYDPYVIGKCTLGSLAQLVPGKLLTRFGDVKSTDGIHLGKLTVLVSVKKRKPGPTSFMKGKAAFVTDVRKGPLVNPKTPVVQQIVNLEENSCSQPSKFARYQMAQSGVVVHGGNETQEETGSERRTPFFALGENGRKVIGELVEKAERLHHEMVRSVMEDELRPRLPEQDSRVVKSGEQALVSLSAGEPDKEPSLFPFTSDTDSFSCLSSESFEDPSTMAVAAQYLFPHSRKQCADLPGNVPSPSAAKQLIEAARAPKLHVCRDKESKVTVKYHDAPTSTLKSKSLQVLVTVLEGRTVTLDPGTPSNPYLSLKIFCADRNPIKSQVFWQTENPQFSFRRVFSINLSDECMRQYLFESWAVLEVWHKGTHKNEDELIGLVKLSLHPFYNVLSSESVLKISMEAEFPIVAVNSFCSVINPFTGKTYGEVAVVLAMGTHDQVQRLADQLTHQTVRSLPTAQVADCHMPDDSEDVVCGKDDTPPPVETTTTGMVDHVMELLIEKVEGLPLPGNSTWGEADCFIQYQFPSQTNSAWNVEVFATPTTLCVPSAIFSYKRSHEYHLANADMLQRKLEIATKMCDLTFEVWARYYYPNIRDVLLAKTHLPLMGLCGICDKPGSRAFALQLCVPGAAAVKQKKNGTLHLTLTYKNSGIGGQEEAVPMTGVVEHVMLSVRLIRAAGLKDAFQSLELTDFNTYARVKIPLVPGLISKELNEFVNEDNLEQCFELSFVK